MKVTATAQFAPAATLEPQLFVWVKSLALVPESAMLVMLKAALPELVRVRFWAALVAPTARPAKVRLEGDRLTAHDAPVPVMLTVCEPPPALSVIVTAAVRAPAAAGLKVTLIAQLAPATMLEPQLFVWAKSLALVPESAMPVTLKDAAPLLVRVIV